MWTGGNKNKEKSQVKPAVLPHLVIMWQGGPPVVFALMEFDVTLHDSPPSLVLSPLLGYSPPLGEFSNI